MHDPYRALYIHLPFCKQRCLYCDFETEAIAADDAYVSSYAERLVGEIRSAAREGELAEVQTVYFGGGTPSYVPRVLTQLLYTLSLSMHLTNEIECSVEANPESLTSSLVHDIWALGANRLSLGAQSFDDDVLRILGRIHSADDALRALDAAFERFENVSVDLMCGIPGQSLDSLEASVRRAIDSGVAHVSIYPLTIEAGTPFYSMVDKGEMPLPNDDTQAEHMQLAARLLTDAGFHRYEVASYTKPGFECRHNTAYWTGVPYLGLGTSAVTMTQNSERRMRKQHDQITDDLDARLMMAEDLMLRMRMSAGVPNEMVERACAILPATISTLEDLVERGLVVHEQDAWKPTEQGWLCGNELYGSLFDLAP